MPDNLDLPVELRNAIGRASAALCHLQRRSAHLPVAPPRRLPDETNAEIAAVFKTQRDILSTVPPQYWDRLVDAHGNRLMACCMGNATESVALDDGRRRR